MIIGINATYLSAKEKTGIENFSSQLIINLLRYDHSNTYYLFSSCSINKKDLPQSSNYHLFVSPFPRGWHRFRLPLSLIRHKVDIFMDPGYTVPPFVSIPSIAFIHDLAHKYYPDCYSPSQRKTLERAFQLDQKKAAAIIFASKQTLADFNKFYPDARSIKKVIYQVYPTDLFAANESDQKYLKIDEKYILFVGRIEERKNIINLLKAYTQLRHQYPEIRHKLVLAGKPGYGHAAIAREIKNIAKFGRDIIETGYIPDKDIARLYRHSDLFIYPSWYEGFGIPILEAFAAGTPVVTANSSSLPEVAGDAALYIDPAQPQDICQKMFEIISQPDVRKKLIAKGKNRLHAFSWEKYCGELIEVINQLKKINNL